MRELIEFVIAEARADPRRFVFLSCLSAIATTIVLGTVNVAAGQVEKEGVSLALAVLFLAALGIYVLSQRTVLVLAGNEIEGIVHRLRVRLEEEVRRANLRTMGEVGREPLFAALTRHTRTISQTLAMLVFGAQQAILIFFAGLYLAWLSPLAFMIAAVFTVVAAIIHVRRIRRVRARQIEAEAAEQKVSAGIGELLDGFKEIRMNARRADALMAALNMASEEARQARVAAKRSWNGNFVAVQLIFYTLIGLTVFAVPLFTDTYHDVVIKVTTTMLFLIGPIGGLAQSLFNVDEARSALRGIRELQRRLREAMESAPDEAAAELPVPKREIVFEDVTFAYRDAAGQPTFTVGPVSLTLKAGETVFISGGNGSGKSTFLLLLTGLVQPDSGQIKVDGQPLDVSHYQAYRDSISAIFTEYHLFQRLYGIGEPDPETARRLLEDVEVSDKTAIQDGAFTTVALSAGQRKRLALAAVEMEGKPMLVLDEWAADQDPLFRRKFYGGLLDDIAGRHRFRILVTHDDRWFDRADRLLHMVDGAIRDVTGEPGRWAPR